MFRKSLQIFLLLLIVAIVSSPALAQRSCFTAEARAEAERTAKVWEEPDPNYDPVLGYNSTAGPRVGALTADANGLAAPLNCVANKKENEGAGTTPKFYCSVAGVVDNDGELVRYKIKPHFKGQSPDKRNGEIYGEFLIFAILEGVGFLCG